MPAGGLSIAYKPLQTHSTRDVYSESRLIAQWPGQGTACILPTLNNKRELRLCTGPLLLVKFIHILTLERYIDWTCLLSFSTDQLSLLCCTFLISPLSMGKYLTFLRLIYSHAVPWHPGVMGYYQCNHTLSLCCIMGYNELPSAKAKEVITQVRKAVGMER